jgi:sugar lactone lactonase YvrE
MRAPILLVITACTAPTAIPHDGGRDERAPMTRGMSTLGGWSEAGYLDGPRDMNLFANPVNVAVGPDGRLYVADFDNNRVRVLDMDGTAQTLLALPRPFGLAFAGTTLFVQTDNDPTNAHSGMTGTIWSVDTNAKTASVVVQGIGRPRGIVALRDGTLAVSDYVHHVVERIDPQQQTVTPLAGEWDVAGDADGPTARFNEPYGMVERPDGTLLVADRANHRIRSIDRDGVVSTFAGDASGFADGPIADARFAHPQALAITSNGDVFVADSDNYRVRRITADGIVTIAGSGIAGYGDDDDPTLGQLYGLEGLCVTPDGRTVVVADGTRGEDVPYNRVRVIERGP